MLEDDTNIKSLIARIARQEKAAFDELYAQIGKMLYSITYSLLGSEAEAKDVFQEALVKIWKRAGDYDSAKGNAIAWLARVTRNTALDKLRSKKRYQRAVDDATEEAGVNSLQNEPESTAGEALVSKETAATLRAAMQKLPEDQGKCIELAFLKGMTQTEIAEALETPLGTVKARIRRGMIKLQSSLKTIPR